MRKHNADRRGLLRLQHAWTGALLSRRTAFAIAVGPAIAWIPVTLWLHAHLDEWIASGGVLPLGVRLALFAENLFIRAGAA